ncbi:MAG TPA: ATP-binding protein [Symbiobacteriaceae bacterium]|nr:ATP-binding protein [Symbiobacteriaceae bacterium]
MANALAMIPRTPAGQFRLYLHGAVLAAAAGLRRILEGEEATARFPFLNGYLGALRALMPDGITWGDALPWFLRELTAWESGTAGPFSRLGEGGFTHQDRLTWVLIGLGEEDARFGDLWAALQGGERRPTWEGITRLLAEPGAPFLTLRTLLAHGLIEVADRSLPRSEWALYVPPALWEAGRGDLPDGALPPERLSQPAHLGLSAPDRERLEALGALMARGEIGLAVIRGLTATDREAAAGAVARASGRPLLPVGPALPQPDGRERLGALALLTGAIPLIGADLAPGERLNLPELGLYRRGLLLALGGEGGVEGPLAGQMVTLQLSLPDREARATLWVELLGDGPDSLALADRFQIAPALQRAAGVGARHLAQLEGRSAPNGDDVQRALRSYGRQGLQTGAVRMEPRASLDHLVLDEGTEAGLQELLLRCRHREALGGALGPAAGGHPRGVRALLSGPSGTGKTMAATALAGALGKDLYRLELAAVVSKYIGETEKNLSKLLAQAEELDVILLLDEGDALLGRRSEVKSANDRYANLETNYLLQRLEPYSGIILITTNAADQIDTAFRRRLDLIVPFLSPGPAERLRLWQGHLPPDHTVPPAALAQVAELCALTGGQIRNSAALAVLLALDERAPVGLVHLQAAIAAEYRKAGALSPLPSMVPDAAASRSVDSMGQFVANLRGGGGR